MVHIEATPIKPKKAICIDGCIECPHLKLQEYRRTNRGPLLEAICKQEKGKVVIVKEDDAGTMTSLLKKMRYPISCTLPSYMI